MPSSITRHWLLIAIVIVLSVMLYASRTTQTYRTRADQSQPTSRRCVVSNGENRTTDPDGTTTILTCNNSIPEGPEIRLNPQGATLSYSINHNGKTEWHYFQIPEQNLTKQLSPESQKELCKNIDKYTNKRFSYTCQNGQIHGIFIEFDSEGSPYQKIHVNNGQLHGTYEEFMRGRLLRRLEFKNGILNGHVVEFDETGIQLYNGTYHNGKQEGVFHFQATAASAQHTIEFHNGRVVRML